MYANFTLNYLPPEDPKSISYQIEVIKTNGQVEKLTGTYSAGYFQQFILAIGCVNAQVLSSSTESLTLSIKAL